MKDLLDELLITMKDKEEISDVFKLLKELKQLRKSQLQPAVRFLGNSIVKQLYHMHSELDEVENEMSKNFINKIMLAMEVVDLQMSCQTFLEGSMGLSKEQIAEFVQEVKAKNDARKYNESPAADK
jgi:hypothetical protein